MPTSCLCFISALPLYNDTTTTRIETKINLATRFAKPVKTLTLTKRTRPSANLDINKTTDSNREDDIASKIASLRKQKRLQSQRSSSSGTTEFDQQAANSDPAPAPSGFNGDGEASISIQQTQSAASQNRSEPTDLQGRQNINETTSRIREEEIASKIASLRKQKRLGSQQPGSQQGDLDVPDLEAEPSVFSQLPDWKKEQILQSQMEEAESFFSRGPNTANGSLFTTPPTATPDSATSSTDPNSKQVESDVADDTKQGDEKYKPKVSTWGVFPRPDNISRAYGGGRGIARGKTDANLRSEEQQGRDKATAERLAKYRASRGIDNEKEQKHEARILSALEEAEGYMRRSEAPLAANTLEGVTQWVSNPEGSRLGGRVWLALALAYEASGRTEQAKTIYGQLRKNPYDEISSKVKQLRQGFADMEALRLEHPNGSNAIPRVIEFSLPDLNVASEKRYETVVFNKKENSSKNKGDDVGLGTNIALVALFVSPILLLLLLTALKH